MRVNIYTNIDYNKKDEKKWQLLVEGSSIHADKVTINCLTETAKEWVGNSLIDSIWCNAVKLQLLKKNDNVEVIID